MPKVVIVDKNPLVLSGLGALVERDATYSGVETYSTGSAFFSAPNPGDFDCGIVGWDLPDMDGGQFLSTVRERKLKTRFVVYTGNGTISTIRQSMKLGAWGFHCKTEEPEQILLTIAGVLKNRMNFPYVDMGKLYDNPLASLTDRERELLIALANGWTNHQIASRTGISQNTVKYHLKNLYEKLGVKNRAMAVALYVANAGS